MSGLIQDRTLVERLEDRARVHGVAVESLLEQWLDADEQGSLITRRDSEGVAQASEALYHMLAQHVHVGVLLHGPNGEIKAFNQAALEMLGMTEAQLFSDMLREPDHHVIREDGSVCPESERPVMQAARTRQPIRDVVLGFYRPALSDYVWALVSAVPHLDAQGEVQYVVANLTNITDLKRSQQLLQALNDDLEQRVRQRTEALHTALVAEQQMHQLKTQFLSMVSHEFRTPLSVISVNAGLLRLYRDKLTLPQQLDRIERIEAQVRRLSSLLYSVTMLYRLNQTRQTINKSPIDVVRLAHTVIEEQSSIYANGGPFTVQATAGCSSVLTDEALLQPILTNLISNAMKYSRQGEGATLTLDCTKDRLTIIVSDKGIGIPAADQPRLFGLFHRGTNAKSIQGTGLGLAIVKQCVDALGGSISVESEVGVGTTFSITIPLRPEANARTV
jgi:PAS domain S-box-containing protein